MSIPKKLWPETLWLARHGESVANVARHLAEAQGLSTIDFPYRESDVPLSEMGITQSENLGKWFAALPDDKRPQVIYSSPFVRTLESSRAVASYAGKEINIVSDERLRERELGIFDRLTKPGAMEKYPDECARRENQGKYYFRPPGGENWCDVILRLRDFWQELQKTGTENNVLIITHEVVIRCFRCIIESLDETEIMEIDRASDIYNGAITEYTRDKISGQLKLTRDNFLP